jgi:hypothetical protein
VQVHLRREAVMRGAARSLSGRPEPLGPCPPCGPAAQLEREEFDGRFGFRIASRPRTGHRARHPTTGEVAW